MVLKTLRIFNLFCFIKERKRFLSLAATYSQIRSDKLSALVTGAKVTVVAIKVASKSVLFMVCLYFIDSGIFWSDGGNQAIIIVIVVYFRNKTSFFVCLISIFYFYSVVL
jgi:hypothetical protein